LVRVQSPPTDIVEESDRYIVFVDVPGIRPEDIKIYGDERNVVIEGYRSIPRVGKFLTIERFSGKGLFRKWSSYCRHPKGKGRVYHRYDSSKNNCTEVMNVHIRK